MMVVVLITTASARLSLGKKCVNELTLHCGYEKDSLTIVFCAV